MQLKNIIALVATKESWKEAEIVYIDAEGNAAHAGAYGPIGMAVSQPVGTLVLVSFGLLGLE